MEEEYKSNSYKSKGSGSNLPEKKVEQVVTGSQKKRSSIKKFGDVFVGDDATNVKNYVVEDVLIPALKKLLDDIVSNGIHMFLYGDTVSDRNRRNTSRVSYSSYSSSNSSRSTDQSSNRRTNYEFDDVIVDSKASAEEVFEHMDDIIDAYGKVSVGDLYDLVGLTGHYTDNDYGWYNIKSARTERQRDGSYLLVFPKIIPLKD